MIEPLDESARQRALDIYRIVDTLPEEAYEDIVRVASIVCNVPIALVSVVNRDRQWFKARTGLEAKETHRDQAFCDHAIRTPEVLMEVPNATLDPRFVDNPLVTGDLSIRFYAGMPLVTPGGAAIGTICVIDQQPRELDDTQRSALASLARITMNLLEGSLRERELELSALIARAPEPVQAAEQATEAEASPCTVAIFQVQEFAEAVSRSGERIVERALHQLETLIGAAAQSSPGSTVDRVTGSPEVILILHDAAADRVLQSVHDALPAFERETRLRVLWGSSRAAAPDEAVMHTYLRADEALSQMKDSVCEAA